MEEGQWKGRVSVMPEGWCIGTTSERESQGHELDNQEAIERGMRDTELEEKRQRSGIDVSLCCGGD